jgi:hypothetical protein
MSSSNCKNNATHTNCASDSEITVSESDLTEHSDKHTDDSECLSDDQINEVKSNMYFNNDVNKQINTFGVLFYKSVKNKMVILMEENGGMYEDIGGKIDTGYDQLIPMVARIVEQRTDGIVEKSSFVARIKNSHQIYIARTKHVVFIVEADCKEKKLKKTDFPTIGSSKIGWIQREQLKNPAVLNFKVNQRIRSKTLLTRLSEIENGFKFKKSMFRSNSNKL